MQFVVNNIVVLIIVTIMLVIFRRMDNPSRQQSRIRRTADRAQDDIVALVEDKASKLKNMAVEIEVQQQTVRAILQQSKSFEESFQSRFQSMDRVEERIQEYDRVLQDLAKMTKNVEENLQRLHEESLYIDKVGTRLNELQESLGLVQHQSENVLTELHNENVELMQSLEIKILADFDNRSHAIEKRCDDAAKTVDGFGAELEQYQKQVAAIQEDALAETEKRLAEIGQDSEKTIIAELQQEMEKEKQAIQDRRASFLEIEEQIQNLFGRLTREQKAISESLEQTQAEARENFVGMLDSSTHEYINTVQEQRDMLATYFSEFKNRADALYKQSQERYDKLQDAGAKDQMRILEKLSADIEKQGAVLKQDLDKQMNRLGAELGSGQQQIAAEFESFNAELVQRLEKGKEELSQISDAEQSIEAFMNQQKEEITNEMELLRNSVVPIHEQLNEQAAESSKKIAGLKQEILTFMNSLPALLQDNHQSVEQQVYNNLDKRLSDFEQDLIYRMTKLDVLRQDIDVLDKEMREVIDRTTVSLQDKFNDIPQLIQEHRTRLLEEVSQQNEAIRTDIAEITREVNSVKGRAHIDLSNKLEILSQEFLGNLSNKSTELQQSIDVFQEEFSQQLRDLEIKQHEKLHGQEQVLNKELSEVLGNLRKQVQEQMREVEETVSSMRSTVDEGVEHSENSLHNMEKELSQRVLDTRQNMLEHFETQFAQYEGDIQNKVRSKSQELDGLLRASQESVDLIASTIENKVQEVENNIHQVKQMFQEQSSGMFEQLEEDKVAFREEVRGIINDARDQFFAQRHKLINKLEQNIRGLEENLAKIDKRQREFIEQTKLFRRVETMRVELHEHLNYYKAELEQLESARATVRELDAEVEKIQNQSRENVQRLVQLSKEKQGLEALEEKYRSLSDITQSVDRKLIEVNARSDELQDIQARFKHIEVLEKDIGSRLDRLDKKRSVIDVTIKTVDSNFDRLSELDNRIQGMSAALDTFATNLNEVGSNISVLSSDKEQAEKVVKMVNTLSTDLGDLEKRLAEVRSSREWLARAETRFENLGSEIDGQLKQLEHLVRGELKELGTKKESSAPSRDAQKTVLDLAKRGWTVDEIARVTHISKGEVELILEMSIRT